MQLARQWKFIFGWMMAIIFALSSSQTGYAAARSASAQSLSKNITIERTIRNSINDITAPTVLSTVPLNNAENVPVTTTVTINFSEPVTLTGSWYTFTCDIPTSTAIPSTWSQASPTSYVITPDQPLEGNAVCTVSIPSFSYSFYFQTMVVPLAPYVVSSIPINNATDVSPSATISVLFSEAVTVGATSLTCNGNPITVNQDNGSSPTHIFDPVTDMPNGASCTFSIPANQVSNGSSQHMTSDFTLDFTVDLCGGAYTTINAIQQNGSASSLDGQQVLVEGIVTADFQETDQLSGFFMQSLSSDNDSNPATSEGIFVDTTTAVGQGDHVRLTATVEELTSTNPGQMAAMTTLTDVNSLQICETGVSLPAPVQIDLPNDSDPTLYLERFEGMRVDVATTMMVQDMHYLGQFGQLILGANDRIFNLTSDNYSSQQDLHRMLVLDDGSNTEYPTSIPYYPTNGFLRAGDYLGDLVGILDQGRINSSVSPSDGEFPQVYYRLQATDTPEYGQSNIRSDPPDTGGALTVATFDVNNYFVTLNNGSFPPGSPYTIDNPPRGANSADEFTRQETKLMKALAAIHADVFALEGIEAWDGADAVNSLVTALNAELGIPGRYAVIADPAAGTGSDLTQVAIIYDTATVALNGAAIGSNDAIFDHAPVAQRFVSLDNDEKFWAVAAQLHSRDCTGASDLDLDQGDGQGCWNNTRLLQAQALQDLVNTALTPVDPDVLLLGNLSADALETPIGFLNDGGLINEISNYVTEETRYSYIADGASGYTDYALSTPAMSSQLTGMDFWHINADEPGMIDYNVENKQFNGAVTGSPDLYEEDEYASATHDPLIVGLTLTPNHPPVSAAPVDNQTAFTSRVFEFTLPSGAFTDPDVFDTLTYTATLGNGNPLPTWLSFDSNTMTFSGTPSVSDMGTLTIKVVVSDLSNATAFVTFELQVKSQVFLPSVLRMP